MNRYDVANHRHDHYRNPPVRRHDYAVPTRTVSSESLFQGTHEIGISHGDAMYRLKITRQGKLILNK